VVLQCVYLIPIMLLMLRNDAARGPALAAGLALLSSSLTGALAWIVIAGEEAPDLPVSAPAARRTVRLAKLAAATAPTLLLLAVPLLWAVVRAPLPGLLTCFTTCAAVFGAGLVVLWAGKPSPRSDFRARGKENMLSSICGLLNSACWAGLAWTLTALAHEASINALLGATMALAGALLTLGLAWWGRIRPL
jgi:ABC-2 type transport system permease protein